MQPKWNFMWAELVFIIIIIIIIDLFFVDGEIVTMPIN